MVEVTLSMAHLIGFMKKSWIVGMDSDGAQIVKTLPIGIQIQKVLVHFT